MLGVSEIDPIYEILYIGEWIITIFSPLNTLRIITVKNPENIFSVFAGY